MLQFKIGDHVVFQADHRGLVEGMLTRYNRKTVTFVTDDGHPLERLARIFTEANPARNRR
jgi:hypothetical protein